ncbi:MFS transporter [Rhizorhabdus wittichii]|uniref:MFS transporter n=1 Tax=Rhizorhabdus wittichii TaxID=160791 RepID=UPI00178C5CA4|nr:MFS transporter [Rhizorhabdus wittichii]
MAIEFFSSLEASMIYTALPTIARQYGGLQSTGWLVSAFVLVQSSTAAIGGRLGDIFGRRLTIVVILVICLFASLISAFSSDLGHIIFGRALQGVSGALLPLCFGIARERSPCDRMPLWIGVLAGCYSASGAVGFLLGGVLAETAGWQAIFYVTSGLALVLILPVLLVLPREVCKEGPRPSIDWLGGLLMMPAIGGLLLAITYAKDWGWASGTTLGVAGASILLAILWLRQELRHPTPLIDVRLLRDRGVAMGNLCFFLLGLGSMQLPLVVMALIQQPVWTGVGLGAGAALTGLLKLPSNVISMVAGPFGGHLTSRYGARIAAFTGMGLAASAWVMLSIYHGSLGFVVFVSIVVGAGMAMTLGSIPNLILAVAPPERSSEATGMLSVIRTMGVAIGAQLAAVLLSTSRISDAAGHSFADGHAYLLTFSLIAVVTILGALTCLLLPARRHMATGHPAVLAAPAE